jgi:Tfp pilus assembly protein PilV
MGLYVRLYRRGFSIIEALIAMSLVLVALVGVFGVLPFTYGAVQDDSLRAEATSAGQQYMDRVRIAVQTGSAMPGPREVALAGGDSMATGKASDSPATLDLSAACTQPDGADSLLFDCTVRQTLTEDGKTRPLASLESFVTRQL